MYAVCAAVLLGLGGFALVPFSGITGSKRIANWILAFGCGIASYAFLWSVAWFTFRNTFGEIVGSTIGIFALVTILKKWMRFRFPFTGVFATMFFWHTLGYYTGGFAYDCLQGRGPFGIDLDATRTQIATLARLSWGLFYGLGFGAGLSYLLQTSRQSSERPSKQI